MPNTPGRPKTKGYIPDNEMFSHDHRDRWRDFLRDRRTLLTLTKLRLAEKCGIHINQVANMENNGTMPSMATIRKMANALHLPYDYVMIMAGRAPLGEATNTVLTAFVEGKLVEDAAVGELIESFASTRELRVPAQRELAGIIHRFVIEHMGSQA